MTSTAKDAIAAAEERLRIARFGTEDMKSNPARFNSGLMNAVAFARMVSFSLQNMRSSVAEFDDWYGKKQNEMRNDILM